jgi:hypothetical protein
LEAATDEASAMSSAEAATVFPCSISSVLGLFAIVSSVPSIQRSKPLETLSSSIALSHQVVPTSPTEPSALAMMGTPAIMSDVRRSLKRAATPRALLVMRSAKVFLLT